MNNRRSQKVLNHLKNLRQLGLISAKSPYGTWRCEKCNLIFETREELKHHLQDIHGILPVEIIEVDGQKKYECPYCGKIFDTSRKIGGHIVHCSKHPKKKEHDDAHRRAGQTYHERCESGEIPFSSLSRPCSLETREHLSQIRAEQVRNEYLTNFHARVKWYKVKNLKGEEFSVRGNWELNVAKRLNELGIYWTKAQPIKYFKEYWHNYTADFYIPSSDIYIEVKGRYPDTDREKMRLVVEQNPEKKIYFIHECYEDFLLGKVDFDDSLLISEEDL